METRESVVLPWRPVEGYNCFGCSQDNPSGLQLRFVRESDDEVSCCFTLGRAHESYPNVVHGGIAATVLDELMGNVLAICRQRFCFTLGLRTRFIGPLRTGRTYCARARIDPGSQPPVFKVQSEISEVDGMVMITGTGTYRTISIEQARGEIGDRLMVWAADHGYLAIDSGVRSPKQATE